MPSDDLAFDQLQPWNRFLDNGAPWWTKNYQPGVPATIDVGNETLVTLVETACRQGGLAIATDFFGAEMNYRTLGDQIRRAAEGLRRLGVNPGDRVAIALPNCPQHLIAFHAIVRLGAIVVEHNPACTSGEVQKIFEDHGARYAIVADSFIETLNALPSYARPSIIVSVNIVKAMPAMMQLKAKIPFGHTHRLAKTMSIKAQGSITWETLVKHRPLSAKHPRPCPDDIACIQYTSGVTGRSKGSMLTHRNLYANACQADAWIFGAKVRKEVNFAVVPMYHAFGLLIHTTFGVMKQSRQVFFPQRDINQILLAVKRIPPTILCLTPPIYRAIAQLATARNVVLESVKYCISGAMALPDSTRQMWESVAGGLLVEGYGLSEASPAVLANPFFPGRRPQTVGVPFPSTQIKVVDLADATKQVSIGQPGELLVKGPQVFSGYWNDPDATAQTLVDGWLRTGDVVSVDADGFVTIVDRVKDIIITQGMNVSPSEVEELICTHPDIDDCAVVGLKGSGDDEQIVAAIVVRRGVQIEIAELQRWLSQRLVDYKRPQRFIRYESLPRTSLGKISRARLRDELSS